MIKLITILVLTIYNISHASNYTSFIECKISDEGILIEKLTHPIWHEDQATWKFDIQIDRHDYKFTYRNQTRIAYIQLHSKTINSTEYNLTELDIDFSLLGIGVNNGGLNANCHVKNRRDSLEWYFKFISARTNIKILLNRTNSLIKTANLQATSPEDLELLNRYICLSISMINGSSEWERNHAKIVKLIDLNMFPDLEELYWEKLFKPALNMNNFCVDFNPSRQSLIQDLKIIQKSLNAILQTIKPTSTPSS